MAGHDPYPPAVKRALRGWCGRVRPPAGLAGKARVILMFRPGPAEAGKRSCSARRIASGAPEGTVVVNMSTVDPGVNIRMARRLPQRH